MEVRGGGCKGGSRKRKGAKVQEKELLQEARRWRSRALWENRR